MTKRDTRSPFVGLNQKSDHQRQAAYSKARKQRERWKDSPASRNTLRLRQALGRSGIMYAIEWEEIDKQGRPLFFDAKVEPGILIDWKRYKPSQTMRAIIRAKKAHAEERGLRYVQINMARSVDEITLDLIRLSLSMQRSTTHD